MTTMTRTARINQKALAAYRKTHGREIFLGKGKTYDVVIAQYLIERSGRSAEEVWVRPIASEMFRECPPMDVDGYISYPACLINYKYAMMPLDLTKPLIFAPDGTLIDGHHRLYRANCLGIDRLPSYTLTQAEADAC